MSKSLLDLEGLSLLVTRCKEFFAKRSVYDDDSVSVGRSGDAEASSFAFGYKVTAAPLGHAEGYSTTADGTFKVYATIGDTDAGEGFKVLGRDGVTYTFKLVDGEVGIYDPDGNAVESDTWTNSDGETLGGLCVVDKGGTVCRAPTITISPLTMAVRRETTIHTGGMAVSYDSDVGTIDVPMLTDDGVAPAGSAPQWYADDDGDEYFIFCGHSHAEGYATTASGSASHAEGSTTTASGSPAHAEGYATTASGDYSHAEGYATTASGIVSHAGGVVTTALAYQVALGHANDTSTAKAAPSSGTGTGSLFVLGNGTRSNDTLTTGSNAFRVTAQGYVYAQSATVNTGADYAEFFEWEDGNPDEDDRRGYFVTLSGNKITLANAGDYILGVVSGHPCVIGNGDECWSGKFIVDEFGCPVEETTTETWTVTDPETGEETTEEHEVTFWKLNPDFDASQSYEQRLSRPEWAAVGMMGQLPVRDDGTCEVDGYCQIVDGGTVTAAESGYRVIKRNADNVVVIVLK